MSRYVLTSRTDPPATIGSAPSVGLASLVRLRWAFIAAEILVAALSKFLLGSTVDALWVGVAVTVAALTNVGLLAWRKRPPSRVLLASALVLDGVLLTAVLRASGGAMNPFSVLYIVHVALAALLLDGRATLAVAGTTCLGFGSLFLGMNGAGGAHAHHHHAEHATLDLHLRGMLIAYAVAAAFVGYFVYRVARALERREREMVSLRDWAARTERLASLSTLAAGAAHELGTPLATIAVVAKELDRMASKTDGTLDREALSSDARLVREEAERCRHIIAKMASDAGAMQGEVAREVPVHRVVELVRDSLDKERARALAVDVRDGSAAVKVPKETLVQVLVNLVGNAFDASATAPDVCLRIDVGDTHAVFAVEDRGSGISEDVSKRLGEPFFSSKNGRGMGLGLFLARTFAERIGGTLTAESRDGGGSTFILSIPRAAT